MIELPDGSGFTTMHFPLPRDHWIYAPTCAKWDDDLDTSADTPFPVLDDSQRSKVQVAIRWAIRGATANGSLSSFDPDALVQNAVYALCGPAEPICSTGVSDMTHKCKCEHWQVCPTCTPEMFGADGNLLPPKLTLDTRLELLRQRFAHEACDAAVLRADNHAAVIYQQCADELARVLKGETPSEPGEEMETNEK